MHMCSIGSHWNKSSSFADTGSEKDRFFFCITLFFTVSSFIYYISDQEKLTLLYKYTIIGLHLKKKPQT